MKNKKPFFLCSKKVHFGMLFLLVVLICSGCASSEIPMRLALSADEEKFVMNEPMFKSVLVKQYKYPAYSDELFCKLTETGIFEKVFEEKGENSSTNIAYVATVNRQIYGTAIFPFWTLISLGVIPTYCKENFGISFYLTPISHPEKTQQIEVKVQSVTVLGWWALVLNVFEDRTFSNPENTKPFRNRLKFEILKALENKNTKPE